MTIRHKFTSGKAAASDPTLVDGPNWDETHVLDGGSVDQVLTRDPAFDPPSGDGWKWAYPKIRETGGPATLTPGAIPDGSFLARQGSAIVGVADVVRVLDRKTAVVDVTNSIVETDLYRFTVPAGTLGTNRGLRLTVLADWKVTINPVTDPFHLATIRWFFGASQITTTTVGGQVDDTERRPMRWVVELWAKGSPAAQLAQVQFVDADALADGAALVNTRTSRIGRHYNLAEDSTVAKDLAITAQWNLAHAGVSVRLVGARLELLP